MYWPNSTEQMTSLVVVLDTLEQDSPEDDGIRRHYIPKARLFTDSGQPILHTAYRAFIEAMKEAGRSEQLPEIGGYLLVKWFDTELSRQNTVSRKLWIMRYRAPGVEV
jgi:hypothetical protein